MKPKGPFIPRILIYITGVYVVLGALTQCASFRANDARVKKELNGQGLSIDFYTYTIHGRQIHYAKTGADTLPLVIFVHGSPGSWNAFEDYFKDTALTRHACLISVDRPGYGNSGYGEAEPLLEEEAALLSPLLKAGKNNYKPILVGHSLGGPIIARMAMDYPEQIKSLVFLAPSIDPGMEKKEYYRHFLKLGVIRALLPTDFDVSNLELIPLKGELEKMLPLWKNITIPCTIVHGTKDVLVPYGNVAFFEKQMINAPVKEVVRLEGVNHFIPWSHHDTVKNVILRHLNY